MDVRGADVCAAGVAAFAGAGRGLLAVLVVLLAADIALAAAVRDVAELLDVHVQQRARCGVLIAAGRPAGGPVARSTADSRDRWQLVSTACTVEADRPSASPS